MRRPVGGVILGQIRVDPLEQRIGLEQALGFQCGEGIEDRLPPLKVRLGDILGLSAVIDTRLID